ncbi:MAG: fatty acid desaturase [Gammaproteobacteria bacterium]|nr:fatty acid desaturase [Gammaproteobacteria bacterium]
MEWPTLGVTAAIYAGFALLTWHHEALPSWFVAGLGGYLVAWHGSLQHEVVHGHPTPWRRVNELLVFPSLWLWLPFRLYRETHLLHHADARLTDPEADPESFYMAREDWERCGRLRRALLHAHNTSWGRLLMGPFLAVGCLAARELGRARRRRGNARVWLVHALACTAVLAWVLGACGMGLGEYLLLFVYPGLSLTLLRSFAEHRARPAAGERTAIVEAGPIVSLLFLNNNLHALHHAEPWLAWYRLPARYRQRRTELLAANGGYWYPGFASVVRHHLLRPKEPVAYPLA